LVENAVNLERVSVAASRASRCPGQVNFVAARSWAKPKFRVWVYAIDSVFGVCLCGLAILVWSARIEPDFEPNYN